MKSVEMRVTNVLNREKRKRRRKNRQISGHPTHNFHTKAVQHLYIPKKFNQSSQEALKMALRVTTKSDNKLAMLGILTHKWFV